MSGRSPDGLDVVSLGDQATISRTVTESDVYLFAGLSGDMHPDHVDGASMRRTSYGHRVAHGALLVAYMSAASARFTQRFTAPTVSYGYDRIRFVRPVFLGDTVTVEYTISSKDEQRVRALADIRCTNQRGEVVAVGTHIMQFLSSTRDTPDG
jgi:acyl dehydratase